MACNGFGGAYAAGGLFIKGPVFGRLIGRQLIAHRQLIDRS